MFRIGSVNKSVDASRQQNDSGTILGKLFQQQTQLPCGSSELTVFKNPERLFITLIQDLIFLSVQFIKPNRLMNVENLPFADFAAVKLLADCFRRGFGNQNASLQRLRCTLNTAGKIDGFSSGPYLNLCSDPEFPARAGQVLIPIAKSMSSPISECQTLFRSGSLANMSMAALQASSA